MKHTIRIADTTGKNAVTLEEGQAFFDKIAPLLKQNEIVEIDFEGVRICTSSFLNAAIGQLVRDFSAADLAYLIETKNIKPYIRDSLQTVIANAKAYYQEQEP